MARIKKEELLEKMFGDNYEHLKTRRLRMTRVRVPGKEVCLAHVLTPQDPAIYQNLGLHIGVHEGEDHTGESLGLVRVTPWESVTAATAAAGASAALTHSHARSTRQRTATHSRCSFLGTLIHFPRMA